MSTKGRPVVINTQILQKLEFAFKLGASDKEACVEAGISPQTLYNYQSKNPDFLEHKEAWKSTPVLKARKAVIDGFDTNPTLALKYLEKKLPEEFGAHGGIHINVNQLMTPADLVMMIEERNKKIRASIV
jgi:hypothetical protein